jgi:hypothetical protein
MPDGGCLGCIGASCANEFNNCQNDPGGAAGGGGAGGQSTCSNCSALLFDPGTPTSDMCPGTEAIFQALTSCACGNAAAGSCN